MQPIKITALAVPTSSPVCRACSLLLPCVERGRGQGSHSHGWTVECTEAEVTVRILGHALAIEPFICGLAMGREHCATGVWGWQWCPAYRANGSRRLGLLAAGAGLLAILGHCLMWQCSADRLERLCKIRQGRRDEMDWQSST